MARGLNGPEVREVEIIDLAHDGRGVARIGGKAVFVRDALPGERVRVRVVKRRRQFDEALTEQVLEPSAERVAPACTHFGVCGGCALQHLDPGAQLAAKQRQLLENLTRIGGVEPRTVYAPLRASPWGYRRRARLGVKYVHKKGRVLAGFRERDQPYLADLRSCRILEPRFLDLPAELAALVETLSIRERVPQVEVAAGDRTAALVFRVLQPPDPEDLRKLGEFGAARDLQIHLQTGGPDSVRPLREGYPPLSYALDGGALIVEFGPIDFIQINREVNLAMVEAAMSLLAPEPDDSVLDLFCGLGNFTLPAGRRARQATGVEGDPQLIARAQDNATRNGIGNAQFFADNLFEPKTFGRWSEARYQRVLLDPPLAGAAACLAHMAHWRPRRVVYISCHPGSLARDAGSLVRDHGFELVGAGVMDMFAHTTHVESIAVFEPAV